MRESSYVNHLICMLLISFQIFQMETCAMKPRAQGGVVDGVLFWCTKLSHRYFCIAANSALDFFLRVIQLILAQMKV